MDTSGEDNARDETDRRRGPSHVPTGAGASDLVGLFAPPPGPIVAVPPSETDSLLGGAGGVSRGVEGDGYGDGYGDGDGNALADTIRTINHATPSEDHGSSGVRPDETLKNESGGGGRDFFLQTKTKPPSAKRQPWQVPESTQETSGKARDFHDVYQKHNASCLTVLSDDSAIPIAAARKPSGTKTGGSGGGRCYPSFFRKPLSLLAPLTSLSTWMGGFMFVLYHVVFCMANGGSITRPHSGISMLGDMVRYTAVGILASCPFLVYNMSDNARQNRVGIPAMYPSADLFLAPFLAQAAAAVDKCIWEDWNSGALHLADFGGGGGNGIDGGRPDDEAELALTRLWFGSFAVVVSFGMFASGSLLVLATKIKLANLGTYLPYGVLCGFFSAVGCLMWKLAITIDTPTSRGNENGDPGWTLVLVHHLPSVFVGIAMNQLGPKHPFFVTGLILFTVLVFFLAMHFTGVSLEDAQRAGWFYSHEDLQSSSLSSAASDEGIVASDSWIDMVLPPCPMGTWVAIFRLEVYWKAVFLGAENMVALAVLYLLRSSIHAAALKKNVHYLVRRVPVENPEANQEEGNALTAAKNTYTELPKGAPAASPRHRRTASSGLKMAFDGASQLAQSVRNEVLIVNMSLCDRKSLKGKCYPSSRRGRTMSLASNATALARNVAKKENALSDAASHASPITYDSIPRTPLKPSTVNETDEDENIDLVIAPLEREVSGLSHRTIPSGLPPDISSPDKMSIAGSSRIVSGSSQLSNNSNKTEGNAHTTIADADYVEIHAPASDMKLEYIFVQYGYGLFVAAVCGGFGCCPTIATSNTMYAIGAGRPAPQYLSVALLLVAFYVEGFEIVRFIPKAAFSSLLVLGAVDSFVTWFIKPISKMASLTEWSVVPFMALLSLLIGFLPAVFLGIGLSTFLFVADFFRVGVVKHDASGSEIRSRIERSLDQSIWLDTNGDYLRVIVLQNYLFFGNASSLLRYIETMFEAISLTETERIGFPIPPTPLVLVLDLSLITGMDTSTVDVFMEIWRMCKSNDCKLYLCGLSLRLKKTFTRGGMKPEKKGPRKTRTLLYFSDLDHGLGKAEDVLIDTKMDNSPDQSLSWMKNGISGFHVALRHIDELHATNLADSLLELEPHTNIVNLEEGQILFEKDGGVIRESDHGLFFIESGMIRIEDDSYSRTNTRTGGSSRRHSSGLFGNENSLSSKHARLDTAAQRASLKALARGNDSSQSKSMRIGTAGPGWVIGTHEFATGQHPLNIFKAVTKIKMHHIRFSDLARIEEESPALVLRLYKMLTHVMARKEEDTVSHLSTLHTILSSCAHSKPPITKLSRDSSAIY